MKPGETRNPNGRPKKGTSLTETMRAFLEKVPPGQKHTYRQLFVQKSFQKAFEGDPTFAKLVWNYIDDMPQQRVDHTSDGEKIETVTFTVQAPEETE